MVQNIVIVGGGGAGSLIARALSQQLTPDAHYITLIEERDYYLHYPASLRMLVTSDGTLEDKVLIPFDKLFSGGNGKVVNDAVSSISPNPNGTGGKVITKANASYDYDVLVLASGTIWEGPLSFPPSKRDALVAVNEWREKIRKSKAIAIIGGGAVGTELAGEIRDVYPDTPVTIVHRDVHLLNDKYPVKFRADVEKRWTQRNISVLLDEEVESIPSGPITAITTRKGTRINADLVIPCRGGSPNTEFIASLGSVLTPSGRVKVDKYLQVEGFPSIFAAGDIIEWDEVKQVAKYAGHSTTITTNVKDVLSGKPPSAVYKLLFEVLALTNGSNGGATYMGVLWGLLFGNMFTRMIKSKDLFISHTRKGLGY